VSRALASAAQAQGARFRLIDLPTLRIHVQPATEASDKDGPISVTHLAPALLYAMPAAAYALDVLHADGVRVLNSVSATRLADDKAATAVRLHASGIAQLATTLCPQDLDLVRAASEAVGYPVVVKRTAGAQGRWVRRAATPDDLSEAFAELAAEGPGALVVQPLAVESAGQSVRVIVTRGQIHAATLRKAIDDEWRSNIALGGEQVLTSLSEFEVDASIGAAHALGLGHAGVDLLRTSQGSVVLEVNAYPDFTSMRDHTRADLAGEVVAASLLASS
jgi:ribosomal protein S6--L-glutamate ligase